MILPLIATVIEDNKLRVSDSLQERLKLLNLLYPIVFKWPTIDLVQIDEMNVTTLKSRKGSYVMDIPLNQSNLLWSCLDNGLHIGFFRINDPIFLQSDENLDILASLPWNRIGISVNLAIESMNSISTVASSIIQSYIKVAGHICFSLDTISYNDAMIFLTSMKSILNQNDYQSLNLYFNITNIKLSADQVIELSIISERIHILCNDSFEGLDISELFIKSLKTDRSDGLFTTVVCDEYGICLGLVYSNEMSIHATLQESRGIYWSRSRNELWKKGESSGMTQELLSIDKDCDSDALRFTVVQKGNPASFCHLMTRTCWGESRGITRLQEQLFERMEAAPKGSYTKRLFEDPSLLQKKLLEEVQELIEATEMDHIAAEAADVTYFMMVRCVAAGVTLHDIERHLDSRALKVSRRPGNAKEWRSQKAESILKATEKENGQDK